MTRNKQHFYGVDLNAVARAGAKNMLEHAMQATREREVDGLKHVYDLEREIAVLVFKERDDPPLWRMETLGELQGGIPMIKVYDPDPAMLKAELRNVLGGKFVLYGVARTDAEARRLSCKVRIREMGTILPKDSERFLGERG
ncbi:MAG TPA: hypothetical protein VFZ61_03720 [Polyangiales bacterium]